MSVAHADAMGVLIQADLDGELDAVQAADLARHLAACDECRQLSENLRLLKGELGSQLPRYRAPPALREAVLRQANRPLVSPGRRRPRWRWGPWLPAFGTFLAGAAIAALIIMIVLPSPPTEEQRIAAEVATATERSLQPGHMRDVESGSPAALAAFFRARLKFAPPARQPAGFRLAGGRLDYLHHRPVAVLAYDHAGNHAGAKIELYAWPEEHAPTLPESQRAAGFALTYWRQGGIEYWAIGRSEGDLEQFVRAWQQAT